MRPGVLLQQNPTTLQVLDLDLESLQSGEEGIRSLNQDNILIESIIYAVVAILNMSWNDDVWAKMIRESIELAADQVKRNIEIASEMARISLSSGTLG